MPADAQPAQVVFITGAASGIGRATAERFAARGARLLLTDVKRDAGQALADHLCAQGAQAHFQACDVTRAEQVDAAVQTCVECYGRLDAAFNNAGIEEENAKLADADEALFDRLLAINVKGVFLCMRAQLRVMQAQGSGRIVNTASVAGLIAAPRHAIYAASKHAVVGLSKSAAVEYARLGIAVNTICPAVIRTPMYERAVERDPKSAITIERMHPAGRIGEVTEVADAVVWLCSDAAGFITGHQLAIDGGLTAL
ncbi:MAG: glucose 1-dehydrogenase [Lysobacterales bacterium]